MPEAFPGERNIPSPPRFPAGEVPARATFLLGLALTLPRPSSWLPWPTQFPPSKQPGVAAIHREMLQPRGGPARTDCATLRGLNCAGLRSMAELGED